MKHVIYGPKLPNMPYEEKPEGFTGPVWRYSKNPITKRNPFDNVARVFNSAVIPYGDGYIGVFRGDKHNTIPSLFIGTSKDGVNFDFNPTPIEFVNEKGEPVKFDYAYDPRIIPLEDKYYIVFCASNFGPTIMIAETTDFKKFVMFNSPFLPFNRNGVLFPRKVNGEYVMFSRPSDNGHTPFGDVFMSTSKDLRYWGNHTHVLEAGWEWWCGTKVGIGPVPIETDLGWLVFFHGVHANCNNMVYSLGAAILDRDDPSKVLHRCSNYLLTPEEDYETKGFVPNVLFPVSALADSETGRIAIYCGAADTYTELVFTDIDSVVDYIMKYDR